MSDTPRPDSAPAPASASPAAPPGEDQLLERLRAATLGEYDIYGELGRGGMATVYLAHEIALDRKVAIKVMAPALSYGPGMVERFKREARTAAQLSHPNIIPVYAVREAGELLFFVMKLVEGTPLDSVMRELGQLPIPMIEAVLAQVGGAFGYAHRRGVIHRDIKPSNILIDEEGWAIVTDFGIAKVQESEGLTQTGVAVGTPTYMSPEQCSGGQLTGASDQYSLGVVAYEMLTGRPPFSGNMMALLYAHFHEPVSPIETLRPDCPVPLRMAVTRMLEKEPSARWPSMEEAVAALGARQLAHDDPTRSQLILLARSGSTHRIVSQVQTPRSPVPISRERPAATPPAGQPAAAPASSRSPWKLALLGVGAVALAVGLWTLRGPGSDGAVPPAPAPDPGLGQVAPPPSAAGIGNTPQLPPGTVTRDSLPRARQRVLATPTPAPPAANPQPVAPGPPPAPPAAADPVRQPVTALPPVPPAPTVAAESTRIRPESAAAAPPTARLTDERSEVTAVILAYARALEAADLAEARRLYPKMPVAQRQGLEAFWRSGNSMRTRWNISDVVVSGDVATARVQGSNLVNARGGGGQPAEQAVSLRARLVRRAGEWKLTALVN